jgi:hypothetical protein
LDRDLLTTYVHFGIKLKTLRNSGPKNRSLNPLFERSEFGFISSSKLNFSLLFTALGFLLRFWAKPKMKSQSG